jgi:crossover junction endodeoxyribonuclease RusA
VSAPLTLTIIGLPAQQGSKTRMPNGAMVDGNSAKARANLKAWREAVAQAVRSHLDAFPASPLAEPVRVDATYRFPVVASDPYRTFVAGTPDLDKLDRALGDALTQAGLLADDKWIVAGDRVKVYAGRGQTVGAEVTVSSLADVERREREAAKERAAAERRAAKGRARQASLLGASA